MFASNLILYSLFFTDDLFCTENMEVVRNFMIEILKK